MFGRQLHRHGGIERLAELDEPGGVHVGTRQQVVPRRARVERKTTLVWRAVTVAVATIVEQQQRDPVRAERQRERRTTSLAPGTRTYRSSIQMFAAEDVRVRYR